MKPVPHRGTTNIKHHPTKFSRPGFVYPCFKTFMKRENEQTQAAWNGQWKGGKPNMASCVLLHKAGRIPYVSGEEITRLNSTHYTVQ